MTCSGLRFLEDRHRRTVREHLLLRALLRRPGLDHVLDQGHRLRERCVHRLKTSGERGGIVVLGDETHGEFLIGQSLHQLATEVDAALSRHASCEGEHRTTGGTERPEVGLAERARHST